MAEPLPERDWKYLSEVKPDRLAFAALWTRCEIVVEGFVPFRIKHRNRNSTSTQQPEMSLVAIDLAQLSKVSYMARTTVF